MKPNPGGQLNPEEIVGRDKLIAELWEILSRQNVYMNDLRRIGKTMILHKMKSNPAPEWTVVKRDLGGLRTCSEFATKVYRDSMEQLSKRKRTLRRMQDWLGNVGEVGGILKLKDGNPAPWKEILTRTFADLHDEYESTDARIVFFWDEVPFLLDNIRTDEGPTRAMEVLDTLRSLSQDYSSVRMLLTGSIGIHHVLTQLRKDGYHNSPLNTFEPIAPGPLEHKDAVDLAYKLLQGLGHSPTQTQTAAETLASLTGDVPFYIHRLVSRLPPSWHPNSGSLEKLLDDELLEADNDWDLAHYRNRISKYYSDGTDEKIVLAILDSLSTAQNPIPLPQLLNEVKSALEADDEQIRHLLKLLKHDHYLTRDKDTRQFRFRLEIVRRWWVLDRGL